ncbi:MarR family winged helix-turn-helix transcriptional regulator [uncultured Phycicoccus sp.]|uniref:MarR family winged helix-turn-helix transcriptional regulator n=1 Tax=uncultured Phycicoccus sp. TaxID=661422 RepID=UPI00262B3AB1|nr:MarR family transcriptional regulator [uncultured Phycicoccus sp.]
MNTSDDGPLWLNDEEHATWLVLSATMMKLPAALDAQLTRDAGLTFFEYMTLAVLSERADRTARMSELAGLANGSLSRLSHVASRLESRGLLVRSPDPTDRRFTVARMTDAGWDAIEAAAPGHVRAVRELVVDRLGPGHGRVLREAFCSILAVVDPSTLQALSARGVEEAPGAACGTDREGALDGAVGKGGCPGPALPSVRAAPAD